MPKVVMHRTHREFSIASKVIATGAQEVRPQAFTAARQLRRGKDALRLLRCRTRFQNLRCWRDPGRRFDGNRGKIILDHLMPELIYRARLSQ